MDEFRRRRALRQLSDLGLVEMKPTGAWGLTREGEVFRDQLELLRELDNREESDGQAA